MADAILTGGCLCGAVRYRIEEGTELSGGHCYCEDCRRTGGTDHRTHSAVARDAIRFEGEVKFYDRTADSGNNVSRGFCPTCGSPVYANNSGFPDNVFISVSSLDDPEAFSPAMVVYTKREPVWAERDEALPSFEAMPPMEALKEVV